ncbi:Zinc-transporting ATPase [bacterium HR15]|nr:Zinc-transporting ATPase [bacterium HR15]
MILLRWLRKRLAESDSCSNEMARTIAQQPALRRIRYDYTRDTVEVEYEANRVSASKAQQGIEPLLYALGERIPTCALRDPQGGICEDCPSVQQHGKQMRINGSLFRAQFDGQVLTVERAEPAPVPDAPIDRFIRRVKAIEQSAESSSWYPSGSKKKILALLWRGRAFWEPVLTGVNLLMLVLGGLANSWGATALATVAYVIAYLAGGYYGALDGLQTLRARQLDVNLLMIMAAIGAAVVGEMAEGGTLLFLFSLSNTLQSFALMRSRRAVRALMALQPDLATRLTDQGEQIVPVEELLPGERVLVRPGERIPTDGIVLRGESHVDQSPITGESVPVHKTVGSQVFAGTINTGGVLEIEVSHPVSETLLHRILRLVEEAQEQKARTQRWLEQFEQRYALAVIGASAVVALGLPLLGWAFHDAFYRAMTLLVVASPCALVISTPATLLSAIANAARHGILFKGGEPIERLASVRAIAIDKTGTLTEGKLVFTDLVPIGDTPESELWQCLLDVEVLSEHPLAQALVKEAQARGFHPQPVDGFEALPGRGVRALRKGQLVLIGNLRLFEGSATIPDEVQQVVQQLRAQGKTAMLIATMPSDRSGMSEPFSSLRFLGVAAVADQIRPTAAQAVQQLKAQGIPCIAMLTGDAEPIARAIAQQTGIERVYADLLPDEKLQVLRQLSQECGPVAMVGDGVNDAPALAAAEVGIAMGAGTDVALETADVALVGNDLTNLPYAVALSRRAMQVLKQNLLFATAVIVMLIILTFTAGLRLPLGVVGHEGSTLLVVLNGLRLLAFRREQVYS